MSITLAPSTRPTIEDIDAELDRFNDEMRILGYDATVRFTAWGEPTIEVNTDGPEPVAQFWLEVDTLDDFRTYANKTIDATSVPRAEFRAAMSA